MEIEFNIQDIEPGWTCITFNLFIDFEFIEHRFGFRVREYGPKQI